MTDRLWAPWRLGYVKGTEVASDPPEPSTWQEGADSECFLCRAAATFEDTPSADRELLVLERTDRVVVLLNRYPYSNAHLLISPLRHIGTLANLTDEERLAIEQALAKWTERLTVRIAAQGFNVGLNLGSVAGAGVPGHLHWHVVPRWPGDHNYMATTAEVRVIPQALEAAWDLLRIEKPERKTP